MRSVVEFEVDQASTLQLIEHLQACDHEFKPPLSTRVDVGVYAGKIWNHATRFEAWCEGKLVGLVAAYLGDTAEKSGHITNVSVVPGSAGQGLASTLLMLCIDRARRLGLKSISLDVAADHAVARRVYSRAGFSILNPQEPNLTMRLSLQEPLP